MECIVRFEVRHPAGNKHLRGLVWTGKEGRPTEDELIGMFQDMNYKVTASVKDKLVFLPVDPGAEFISIRVTELDTGERKYSEDRDLKNLLGTLMPKRPTGL